MLKFLINSWLIIFLLVYLFVEKSLILRSHHCQIKPTHLIYDLLAGSNLYNYGLSVGNDFYITSDVTYDLGFFSLTRSAAQIDRPLRLARGTEDLF